MSLQDEHLKQALKHAPDKDLAPNAAARAAVLAYADKALKSEQVSWASKFSQWTHECFGSSWHSVGLGSAVATLLIVVVVWHEQPDDTIWQVSKPIEESAMREDSPAVSSPPESASAEKMQESAVVAASPAPAPEPQASMAERKLKAETSKAKSDSFAHQATTASKPASEESVVADASAPLAATIVNPPEMPVAAAPVPIAQVSAQDSAVVMSEKSELAKDDAVAKKSVAKPEARGLVLPKSATNSVENILTRIQNTGGKVVANQDIQAGNLRLIAVQAQTKDAETLACPHLPTQRTQDANTGYPIDLVASCDVSERLKDELEIYNQTMREWHDKQQK